MFFPDDLRVYVAVGSVDMRKSINGLTVVVAREFNLDPFTGQLFVFGNRRRNMVKILYWDRNGFCLWQKRLERERFRWPAEEAGVISIDSRQLSWLLDGLSMQQAHAHRRLEYSEVY
ncbi:MAG: IS66 family insertion sequence element accessory protein TnpB [Candidatus Paceibacterota bacterium]|jgi:transposase